MSDPNIFKSIINISKSNDLDLKNYKAIEQNNRIQKQGEGLEIFIKDSFCGIPKGSTPEQTRIENYLKIFSDTGHANNPPDAMIKGGDAIEIKKHERFSRASLALNSSPPRTILTNEDRNIASETRDCETKPWARDYLYIIGNQKSKKLRRVTLCYGNCFVTCDNVYRDFFDKIKKSISDGLVGTSFLETKEFGRIYGIDPQNFTTLRIRSMFELQNPNEIFKDVIDWKDEDLVISAIMRKEKYESFSDQDCNSLKNNKFKIKNFQAKDPDNPKEKIDLVLVRYSR